MKRESYESEARIFEDAVTGRTVRQLTAGSGDEYYLYYQSFPITSDGKWLVFYSQRDGRTDLYRLNLLDGAISRLTRGRSKHSGWWPFSPLYSEGIYDFIACLHPETGRVFYHDLNEIRMIDVETLEDRAVVVGSEQMRPMSQMACSFDGSFITTVWTPKKQLEDVVNAREAKRKIALEKADLKLLERMGKGFDEGDWMKSLHSRLEVFETQTGNMRVLCDRDFPLHNMVICSDNRRIVVVESPCGESGKPGEFLVFDRSKPDVFRSIGPPKNSGGFCHFHACRNSRILFDITVSHENCIGVIDADGSDYRVWPVASDAYCHVGHDRDGQFLFASVDNFNTSCGHHIMCIFLRKGKVERIRLTANLPTGRNQYCHAHPILAPDRKSIFYTALGEDEKAHIYQVDISDVETETISN